MFNFGGTILWSVVGFLSGVSRGLFTFPWGQGHINSYEEQSVWAVVSCVKRELFVYSCVLISLEGYIRN